MNSLQSRLGIHSVNVGGLLTNATNGAISILITVMDWIFLAAELGIMIGALVFLVGALFHQSRWKQTGGRIITFAIIGFIVGMIGPGVIMGINHFFQG